MRIEINVEEQIQTVVIDYYKKQRRGITSRQIKEILNKVNGPRIGKNLSIMIREHNQNGIDVRSEIRTVNVNEAPGIYGSYTQDKWVNVYYPRGKLPKRLGKNQSD